MPVQIPISPVFSVLEWNSEKHETFDFPDTTPQATVHDNTALAPRAGMTKPRVGALFSMMNFSVEIAGEGSALGVAPNIGPLLVACGLDETVSASTSVTYDSTLLPADTAQAAGVDIDKFVGNEVKHSCDTAVGNAIFNFVANQKAFVRFEMQGTYVAPTEANSAASLGDTGRPPVCKGLTVTVNPGDTGAVTLVLKSAVINLNNSIASPREDMAGSDGIQPPKLTNQRPTLEILFEAPSFGTFNPWEVFTAETKTAFALELNGGAFNILDISGDWYPSGFPAESEIDGILAYTMSFVQSDEDGDTKFTMIYT